MLKKLQQEGKKTKFLQRKIDRFSLIKPNAASMNLEFDKKFVDFRTGNHFDLFCRFASLGDNLKIKIPLKHTKVSRKWMSCGNMKTTIRLNDQGIALLFEVPKPPINTGGKVVGADQGSVTALTLSDAQVTDKCPHGHDLYTIQAKLARRKVGSKGFAKAQSHRKNYINWAINHLDFSDISTLKLEKIRNLRKGSRTSRALKHWTYTLINQKLVRLGEEKGFTVTEVSNEFRSQRCSQCGWVRKANRRGKTFKCTVCGYAADSDLNAASNLELDLYEVPYWVRLKKLNRVGFYWSSSGLTSLSQEPIVPDTNKIHNSEQNSIL
jgi:transposase